MARSGTRGKRGTKPPYTSAADINAFFERMRNIGPPPKVTTDWVRAMSLAAAQPEGVVAMLRWLGIVDASGVPDAQRWNKVRVPATRAETLAPLVGESYKEVFDRVDVGSASRADLEGALIDAYNVGSTGRYIGCFQSLCVHAGLAAAPADASENGSNETPATSTPPRPPATRKATAPDPPAKHSSVDGKVSVSINLNVEIPAEWSEEQIRERLVVVNKAVQGG